MNIVRIFLVEMLTDSHVSTFQKNSVVFCPEFLNILHIFTCWIFALRKPGNKFIQSHVFYLLQKLSEYADELSQLTLFDFQVDTTTTRKILFPISR